MSSSENQQRRYSRQIILPEIGEEGQEKLSQSKVLVVGAGGLGSPALLYLAAAGVGHIGIADNDRVELSNLNRQIIHETGDIGRPKVESAKDAIADLNPEVKVTSYELRVTDENVDEVVSSYDIVLEGSDNIDTRFILHKACYNAQIPYISAAIVGFEGQMSVFKGYLENHPCYQCLYPEKPPSDAMPTCVENGVLGAVGGVLGSWQAAETIKEILNIGNSTSGSVLFFNLLDSNVRKTKLSKDADCSLCRKNQLQVVNS